MKPTVRRWIVEQAALSGVTSRAVADHWRRGIITASAQVRKARMLGLIEADGAPGAHNAVRYIATAAGCAYLGGARAPGAVSQSRRYDARALGNAMRMPLAAMALTRDEQVAEVELRA